jgi:hypothetical protein
MDLNLDGFSRNDERVGYFPYTTGIDRNGNEVMIMISHDPTASGCNPFYWDASPHCRPGYEFASKEEAVNTAKYARGSWTVKSVNTDSVKIGVIHFTVVKTAVIMENVS